MQVRTGSRSRHFNEQNSRTWTRGCGRPAHHQVPAARTGPDRCKGYWRQVHTQGAATRLTPKCKQQGHHLEVPYTGTELSCSCNARSSHKSSTWRCICLAQCRRGFVLVALDVEEISPSPVLFTQQHCDTILHCVRPSLRFLYTNPFCWVLR